MSHYPPLTPLVMLDELVRLNDMWPRWEADDKQLERMAHSYHEALNDLDAEVVHGGVSIWLKTSTSNRWPSAAQVRECAMRWVQANRAGLSKPAAASADACPVCGAEPRWARLQCVDLTRNERFVTVRRIHPCISDKHKNGSPYVPFPHNFISWVHDDKDHIDTRRAQAGRTAQPSHRPAPQDGPPVVDVPATGGHLQHHTPAGAPDLLVDDAEGAPQAVEEES